MTPVVKAAGKGAMAQLVARLHGMQKARGSNPRSSTISSRSKTHSGLTAG